MALRAHEYYCFSGKRILDTYTHVGKVRKTNSIELLSRSYSLGSVSMNSSLVQPHSLVHL